MISRELQPKPNGKGFDRKGMDPDTPHGRAQATWDEMVEVSQVSRRPVVYDPSSQKVPTEALLGAWVPINKIGEEISVDIRFIEKNTDGSFSVPVRVYGNNVSNDNDRQVKDG